MHYGYLQPKARGRTPVGAPQGRHARHRLQFLTYAETMATFVGWNRLPSAFRKQRARQKYAQMIRSSLTSKQILVWAVSTAAVSLGSACSAAGYSEGGRTLFQAQGTGLQTRRWHPRPFVVQGTYFHYTYSFDCSNLHAGQSNIKTDSWQRDSILDMLISRFPGHRAPRALRGVPGTLVYRLRGGRTVSVPPGKYYLHVETNCRHWKVKATE